MVFMAPTNCFRNLLVNSLRFANICTLLSLINQLNNSVSMKLLSKLSNAYAFS